MKDATAEPLIPGTGRHVPVLCRETTDLLLLADSLSDEMSPHIFVDCTLGGGGHARALIWGYQERFGLERLQSNFKLIGIDQDASVLEATKSALEQEYPTLDLNYQHANFSKLPDILKVCGVSKVTGGILADIGVSSFQLDQAERGFSFNKSAPLDMRMDQSQDLTAADVVNQYGEDRLVKVFSEYGEERFSKTIARLIVERRRQTPFETTVDLSEMVKTLYRQKLPPKAYRIHPATKVFQALRIEVNRELDVLESMLTSLPQVLSPGARVCLISFHSLEDRVVKNVFRELYQNDGPLDILTKKPIIATDEEIEENPRSRSAKLRCAQRR